MSNEDEVVRIPQSQLLGLSHRGSLCEVCGEHMHTHEWADMDIAGYVVHCSNEKTQE